MDTLRGPFESDANGDRPDLDQHDLDNIHDLSLSADESEEQGEESDLECGEREHADVVRLSRLLCGVLLSLSLSLTHTHTLTGR